jgi:hypothetical protein
MPAGRELPAVIKTGTTHNRSNTQSPRHCLIRALPDGHEGIIAVDDFHRLDPVTRDDLSDYLKLLADEESESRLIIIGIPGVGKSLVDLSFDLISHPDRSLQADQGSR